MPAKNEVYAQVPMAGRAVDIAESIGRINLDDLRTEWEKTGAEVVFLGVVAANARRVANNAKVTLEVSLARLDQEARQLAVARAEKPTEASVLAAVRLNPAYAVLHQTYNDALYHADVAESAKYAAVQKQKNLAELGAMLQAEEQARKGTSIGSPRPIRQPV